MTAGYVVVRWTSKGHIGSHLAGVLAQSRDFNHVMLIDAADDGMVSEAIMFRGVRYCRESIAMRGIVRFQDMPVWVPNLEGMREFLRNQYGRPYDYGGAFGLPVLQSDNWQDDDKWWCSELVLAALGAGGVWLLDPDEIHRATPNDLRQSGHPKLPLNQAASAAFLLARP